MRPRRRQLTRLPRPWDSLGKNTGVGCHFLLQCIKVKSESEVAQSCLTLATPWTAAHQAPPSMGFSRQEYWSGVPLPSLSMNMGVQISPWEPAFNSFGYIPRSRIVGSYGNSIFKLLCNCHTVFHSSYIILHFHSQCAWVSIFLHPHQHYFIVYFF